MRKEVLKISGKRQWQKGDGGIVLIPAAGSFCYCRVL